MNRLIVALLVLTAGSAFSQKYFFRHLMIPGSISEIRTACNNVAAGVTSIHPLLPALNDEPTKSEIVKALFELTKNVEVVKKQVMRLEKRDDSSLL